MTKIYFLFLFSVVVARTHALDQTTFTPEAIEAEATTDSAGADASASACGPNLYEQTNKRNVLSFYQEVFGDKNVDAIDKYIDADTYIQHNPTVADGREALKTAAKVWFKDAPKEKVDVKHVGADDDLVWLHVKSTRDGKITSIIDIFRLNNASKIVEHWDAVQQVPEKSANDHPLF